MRIILARPRGFCAGVERAILCVEEALDRFGPPVYVLNDIVHNAHVVNDLKSKGTVFVKDLAEVPEGSNLLFSAHGVSPARFAEASKFNLEVIDATCPLVEKVHNEARRFTKKGHTVILIGEPGHDETVGTMGWAEGNIHRVLTMDEVEALDFPEGTSLSYITQTTLSVDDCQRVIDALKAKFPQIQGPPSDDICYATTNRQHAVKQLAPEADLVLVVGDVTSANSNRLVEIALELGKPAFLIPDAASIQEVWMRDAKTVMITAGASAPEHLVTGVVDYFRKRGEVEVIERDLVKESVYFKLPKELAASS
jgi:4-hydroxy-3-methylbut-2-enyl diphosphate reductase